MLNQAIYTLINMVPWLLFSNDDIDFFDKYNYFGELDNKRNPL